MTNTTGFSTWRKTMKKRNYNAKVCPCCGAPIIPYQEVCLNCLVYLWEG